MKISSLIHMIVLVVLISFFLPVPNGNVVDPTLKSKEQSGLVVSQASEIWIDYK